MDANNVAPAMLDKAAGHLHAAALHAETLADRDADTTDGAPLFWMGIAGQLRLVGAGLSPTAPAAEVTPRPLGIQDHLDSALASLDRIAPLDGPPDLQLWAWRVADLRSALKSMGDLP